MIELRWLVPVNGERVLQYRQKIDITMYAGSGPFPDSARNMQWSEWQAVPMESERDPAYP